MSSNICASAAKRFISPSLEPGPVYLAGFDANRRATGAHDDLYARASDQFTYPRNPFRPGQHYDETMSPSCYATPLLMETWTALLTLGVSERSSAAK